jgi:hypothetical protein
VTCACLVTVRRLGGSDGNERLTAVVASVLLVLLALEGATLLAIGRFVVPHIFIGFLLIPLVLLKLGSTSWRTVRYYRGLEDYVRRGPPTMLLRVVVAPLTVASTVALFATGVAVAVAGGRGLLLGLHKASFVVWLGVMSVHVLAHVWKLPRLLPDRLPGRTARLAAVSAALVTGGVVSTAMLPVADHWQDRATGVAHLDAR